MFEILVDDSSLVDDGHGMKHLRSVVHDHGGRDLPVVRILPEQGCQVCVPLLHDHIQNFLQLNLLVQHHDPVLKIYNKK